MTIHAIDPALDAQIAAEADALFGKDERIVAEGGAVSRYDDDVEPREPRPLDPLIARELEAMTPAERLEALKALTRA
jgi:hypothetical protein